MTAQELNSYQAGTGNFRQNFLVKARASLYY